MNNKYNKGTSIIEIVISVAIISLVLILMFTLLNSIRHEDATNNVQSQFIINQASFIKAIEEDIVSYGVSSISSCTLADANITASVASGFEDKYKCLKIEYAADYIADRTGFLMIYKYYTKYKKQGDEYIGVNSEWMIQYVRGSYEKCLSGSEPTRSSWKNKSTLMRSMPDNVNLDLTPYVLYTSNAEPSTNAASLVIPIVTLDGLHYDLNLSFTFKGNKNFICDNYDSSKLKCICKGDKKICENTYNYSNICR